MFWYKSGVRVNRQFRYFLTSRKWEQLKSREIILFQLQKCFTSKISFKLKKIEKVKTEKKNILNANKILNDPFLSQLLGYELFP